MTDTHLIFIGPDEVGYQSRLQERAAKMNSADRVHFTGLLTGDSLIQAISDSDLLLMPSAMESFGMSAVEAMAAGVPVLVSEGVPVGYWAEKAGAGRVVPCTVESFNSALQELLQSPEELKLMGARGQELARQKFDIKVVARQMLRQYESIIRTGGPLQEANE